METLVLKIVICSGILLGLYHWFLAKEKTLVFNRFYLIFSVVFSLTIPFLTIGLPEFEEEKSNLMVEQEISQQVFTQAIPEENSFDLNQFILTVYCLIAVFFLAKFIFSILKIKNLKGRKIVYKSRNVLLLKQDLAPFSFWNTIYISEKSFKSSGIDERVFLHEDIHIRQKHSLDLIFIELIKSILWLNPIFYFYKNAMVNNHEFLADEQVITKNTDIKNYQELILQEVLKQQNLSLTHQFNFNNTKKRFIMMTKQNSKFAKAKKFLAIPVFAIAAFVFAEKVYGKSTVENVVSDLKTSNIVDITENNDAIAEYLKMSEKYDDIIQARDFERFQLEVPFAEKKKFMELFNQIGLKDRNKLPFWIQYDEIMKQIPTPKQLLQFQDSKFNISINNKNTHNSVLKNYNNTDFYSVYVLKIQPQHEDYGKYAYGVVLYTNDFAKKYNSEKKMQVSFTLNQKELESFVKKDTIRPQKTVEDKVTSSKNKEKSVSDFAVGSPTQEKKLGDQTIPPPPPPSANFVQAEFPGGLNGLRVMIAENFDPSLFEKKTGTMSTSIFFSVDENGKTTDLKADGEDLAFNNEALRTAKLATNNKIWKPATDNGKNVKTVYKIPLKMQFAKTTQEKTQ